MAKKRRSSKREKKENRKKQKVRQREENRLLKERKEKRDRYFKYGFVSLVLILGYYMLSGDEGKASSSPVISIEPKEYNFDDVSLRGGVVNTVMTIKNTGGSALVINDMETSCGCTSATVEKGGIEGPEFGMKGHGPSPVGWSETLQPGETALLNIYYDPAVHPELRGAVTRAIALYSNDPTSPVKEVRIHVNQVD